MLEMSEHTGEITPEPMPETAEEAKVRKIGEAINELRPYLQRDGGDCHLVGVEGNVVKIKMAGACIGCQMASVTIHRDSGEAHRQTWHAASHYTDPRRLLKPIRF